MSSGASAVQFQINKNNATRGVFFQKDKQAKNEQRKFGYKSKNLRHPIRQPDYEAEMERLQQKTEEEKRKYNKNSKDFIRNNKDRYKPKTGSTAAPPGTTHIAPGTVTLTQEQLTALLQTLGGSSSGSGTRGDNPLLISIDPESNKIEVEKYESDSNRDGTDSRQESRANSRAKAVGDEDNGLDVGIEALLNLGKDSGSDHKPRKSKKTVEREATKTNVTRSREDRTGVDQSGDSTSSKKPQQSSGVPEQSSMQQRSRAAGEITTTSQTRLSWDDAKKVAGVGHVPDAVPWRHLTVGERKRLQWARERAEVEEEYNPWGKPGSGAPGLQKQAEEARNESRTQPMPAWIGNTANGQAEQSAEAQKKKEELANEILKLQMEIREAEQKREKESKDLEEKNNRTNVQKRDNQNNRKAKREKSESRARDKERNESRNSEDQNNNSKSQDFDESRLSKKEIERRKWLAELDKQREEQRLKKQMEKERDRAGVQDQWADRFVYHKTAKDVSPRHAQPAQQKPAEKPRDVQPGFVRTSQTYDTGDHAPPAAMRSSMVVGDGRLNENRYDDKKAEEKRRWLQELEQQREEQRLAKQAEKERDRQESNGTWADSRQTDRLKLKHGVPHHHGGQPNFVDPVENTNSHAEVAPSLSTGGHIVGGGVSPRGVTGPTHVTNTQRTNSAPQPPVAASDDGSNFLRGQGVFVDPVTRREQEEKRRIHLEYQAEVKAQIEEKERQKREERERKAREDMEEERKLQMERDQFNKQLEMEQRKIREKEEQRQKQIDQLKTAMDEAQEKAMEDKTHRRLNHLKRHGHDVSQLKAAYDATPRGKQYDLSVIPGLGPDTDVTEQDRPGPAASPPIQDLVDSARFEPQQQQHRQAEARGQQARYPVGQSYTKEAYVEDRVLTPSRFRGVSRPKDNHNSPQREFGTQTLELAELQNILSSLPEDIQIEYKLKVEDALREKQQGKEQPHPPRKVTVKSADDRGGRRKVGGKPPQAVEKKSAGRKQQQQKEEDGQHASKQRLAWNQRARKTVVKNSERDPFYEQKKEQAEARRAQREKKLQYLQELNSSNIPKGKQPSRSRSRHEHCSPRRGDNEDSDTRHGGGGPRRRGDRSQSPNILALLNNHEDVENQQRVKSKSRSPAMRQVVASGRGSPPIPAVRHRAAADGFTDRDPYAHVNRQLRESQSDNRYGDAPIVPAVEGEFVPFLRTTEILDPARAEEPIVMSREGSRMERARRAYRETHNPADKGRKVDIYQDREREAALKGPRKKWQKRLTLLLSLTNIELEEPVVSKRQRSKSLTPTSKPKKRPWY